MITRHRGLTKHFQNMSNPIVKVKVVLNEQKIKTYSYPKEARLRNILPDLKKDNIYSLDLYYKEEGYYYPSSLKDLILTTEDDRINIYENKNGRLSDPKSDYILFGYSKKKIIIQEVDRKIYHIHISQKNRDNSVERNKEQKIDLTRMDIEFHQTICVDKEIDIVKEIDRILSDYNYEIYQTSDISDEYWGHKRIRDVDVQVVIERKKNIWRRIWNVLFHK